MMSEQFGTGMAQGLERIFADFKYEAFKISGRFMLASLESTSRAVRKICKMFFFAVVSVS